MQKGLITFFFFYYYDDVDPLVAKAFHLVCDEKLISDGYCDMSDYIYARINKDVFLANLQQEGSPLTSLYRKAYPKYNTAKSLWYDFSNSNSYKSTSLSLLEAKAIVNWVYHAYSTPQDRENATIEMLPEFNRELGVGSLAFAHGIIYQSHSIDICEIDAEDSCNLLKNSINICVQTCPFRLILANQLIGRQNFFFLMGIAAEVNVVIACRDFLGRIPLSLIKLVNTNRLTIIPPRNNRIKMLKFHILSEKASMQSARYAGHHH